MKTTATIENGNEIKTITIQAPAEKIQQAKQQIKDTWVRTGGTITWDN